MAPTSQPQQSRSDQQKQSSRCRDVSASRHLRRTAERYRVHMLDPDLDQFSRWTRRMLADLRAERGMGITHVATAASMARSMLTRWRDGDWSKGRPTRETVARLCDRLQLDPTEPFALLGYRTDIPSSQVDDPDLVAVQEILRRRSLDEDDIEAIKSTLRMWRRQFSDRAPRRPRRRAG